MVYRAFVEKKKELANEAAALLREVREFLGIESLEGLRILNRYDAENIEPELFESAKKTVFSEPQLDLVSEEFSAPDATVFAVEYLPGQFDQRADSAAQCIQIISQKDRPEIRTAKVYALYGKLSEDEIAAIKKYVINPVEAREASLEKPQTLAVQYDLPETVATLDGFTKLDQSGLDAFIEQYGLAMDSDDIAFCQQYFRSERRDPTITESRMMMNGHKWDLFVLDLSFLGWYIVGSLVLGVGTLWVVPYHMASKAIFYDNLRTAQLGQSRYIEG